MKKPILSISRAGFRPLLITVFTAGIIMLALGSTFVTSLLISDSVKARVAKEGMNLTKTFANQSRIALLYRSESDAKALVDAMLAFPDMLNVAVYDEKKRALYISNPDGLPQTKELHWPSDLLLNSETDDAWHFVAPVYTGGQKDDEGLFLNESSLIEPELVGYVRLLMGKESLRRMEADIFRVNLMVSIVLAGVLLLILLAITNQMTRPLNQLAGVMRSAKEGAKDIRANVHGTREVLDMERAFNAMMDVLDAREVDLRAARDVALEVARLKGAFAANVSHELRTPLNGVLGMLDLLKGMGLTLKQKEYVEVAAASGEELLNLIEDVLDFSKIDSGKMEIESEQFNLLDLLEETVFLMSSQAQREGLDITYFVDTDIPAFLRGDSGRLSQILINLLGNAIKFTHQGSVSVEVNCKRLLDGEVQLRFGVRDTGIGLSEDMQSKVFEAFSQVQEAKMSAGAGLGLSISQELAGLMGGELAVESELGKGCLFWFDLSFPVCELAIKANDQRLISARVLVVDNSELLRRYTSQLLSGLGIDHDMVGDGVEALQKLRAANKANNPYQCVFVADVIADMNGSDLAALIISDSVIANTRIFIMLNRSVGRSDNAEKLSVTGYLSKPLQRKDIVNVLFDRPSMPEELGAEEGRQSDYRRFEGKRILVVEDNRANQQVVVGMLERLRCQVVVANNGQKALELKALDQFDLVLMDCNMPIMDGYEATLKIRKMEGDNWQLPIVAMTANVQKGEAEKCLAVGMNDYLAKPLKLNTLVATLAHWIGDIERVVEDEVAVGGITEENKSVMAVDINVFDKLVADLGEALPAVIEAFLTDTPGYMSSLEKALSEGDGQAISNMAHVIKGGASNFGALRLTTICQQFEDKGRSGHTGGLEKLLAPLVKEMALLTRELKNHLNAPNDEVRRPKSAYLQGKISDVDRFRILVVDDDRGMRFAMRAALEKDGHRVDEVCSGEQALTYCERFMPDLVLMDAVMPGMGGFKACSQIKNLPQAKRTPVLIITALNDDLLVDRALSEGAADYIAKPVNFSVLRNRIGRLLEGSQAEKDIHELVCSDALTGLPNRAMFIKILGEKLLNIGDKSMVALLFLDLDRFKLVNDTFGHDAGDLLLRVVAERLQGCVRRNDVVFRFGGDEFIIAVDQVKSFAEVKSIANKIHQTLSRPFVFLGQEMHVSISVGISMAPNDGTDISVLLKRADIAMYRAKERGGRYEFYEQNMEADVARRLGVENDLRGAVKRNEIVVFYQPQASLKTGELIGMEALVRWQHPDRGLIGPDEFIRLAEETGQILELGEWVLLTACRQLKEWQDKGYRCGRMAVNLSPRQLESDGIVECIASVIEETGLSGSQLELEITEEVIIENVEEVILTLEKIKLMGVLLAVDDFGVGYSSLNYLQRFPIDLLKIDRAFVANILSDEANVDIISTIISLAHSLEIEVLAEGVETVMQKQLLEGNGCDYMQGYLLGKPVAAEEFETHFLIEVPSAV